MKSTLVCNVPWANSPIAQMFKCPLISQIFGTDRWSFLRRRVPVTLVIRIFHALQNLLNALADRHFLYAAPHLHRARTAPRWRAAFHDTQKVKVHRGGGKHHSEANRLGRRVHALEIRRASGLETRSEQTTHYHGFSLCVSLTNKDHPVSRMLWFCTRPGLCGIG